MGKRIEYILPVDFIAGSISARQSGITYDGVQAYALSTGDKTTSDNYTPILVARYMRARNKRCYQVRTRTSVHLTQGARLNLAVLGGAGAIFAALVNRGDNVHRFMSFPVLMQMLRTKASSAECEGISVDNPWRVQDPNITIAPGIIAKFNSLLS